jgi:hypothetical protein
MSPPERFLSEPLDTLKLVFLELQSAEQWPFYHSQLECKDVFLARLPGALPDNQIGHSCIAGTLALVAHRVRCHIS